MIIVVFAFIYSVVLIGASFIIIGLIEWIIRRLKKQKRHQNWIISNRFINLKVIMISLIIFVTTPFMLSVAWKIGLDEGQHVTYDKAFVLGELRKFPKEATDINYSTIYMGSNADFAISEQDFIKWCAEKGWKPEKTSDYIQYGSMLEFKFKEIKNGLKHQRTFLDNGCGNVLTYDLDTGRAYYHYSHN